MEVAFEEFILFIGQSDLLRVKDTSEFLLSNLTLSERIMILKKLSETDSVLLDLCLQLEHQVSDSLFPDESPLLANVFVLLGLVQLLHLLLESLERGAIVDEIKVPNLDVVGSIKGLYGGHFLVGKNETKVVQSLSELLGGHLEVFVAIPILEEALRIKSISSEPFFECTQHFLNNSSLISGSI
jgi:hypothetical protein